MELAPFPCCWRLLLKPTHRLLDRRAQRCLWQPELADGTSTGCEPDLARGSHALERNARAPATPRGYEEVRICETERNWIRQAQAGRFAARDLRDLLEELAHRQVL